jgi:hypothetical protein
MLCALYFDGSILSFLVDCCHIVSRVTPGGLAEGIVAVGEAIVAVNGTATDAMSHDDLKDLMCDYLRLELLVKARTVRVPRNLVISLSSHQRRPRSQTRALRSLVAALVAPMRLTQSPLS